MGPLLVAILLSADCAPLQVPSSDERTVHVATRCQYEVTWAGRHYDYRPDADGWISDYFIVDGHHGQVHWNVRTNAVVVKPRPDQPLTAEGARAVAGWAKQTLFPNIDLAKLDFVQRGLSSSTTR